jgi:hypothetical protein
MTLLVLGIWALVLCVIAACRPTWLLPAAVLCAPFEGAALNPGDPGVSPYFFTLILIAGRCALVRTERSTLFGRTPRTRLAMVWAAALVLIAVGGAVLLPRVFRGASVLSPRLDAEAAAPLAFSTSNAAQAVYLLLNAGLLWYAAQTGGDGRAVRAIVNATRVAGGIVVALAMYQFAAAYTGLPFPDDVLYSNQAYVMQHGTQVMDLPRLCSTFTEPAGMAVYLVGYLAFLAAEPPSASRWAAVLRGALVVATVAVLALSTSSTAYVGLIGVSAWAVARFVAWPVVSGRPNWRATAAVAAMGAALAVAFVASSTLRELVDQMVFEKNDSDSYEQRHGADDFSTRIVPATWGLGVGLGSNRASSFGPSALSTIGVYGTAALAGVMVQLLRRPSAAGDDSVRRWHAPLAAGLVGVVGTKLVSSPDLVTPVMWTMMAGLLCVQGAADGAPAAEARMPVESIDVGLARSRRLPTLEAT